MTRLTELDPVTLRGAQRGRRRACRALVEMYQRRLYALCDRMLSPRGLSGLVDDTAQEVFMNVFAQLKTFDPAGSARLSTWILTIASRRCLDEIRRSTRRDVRELASTGPTPPAAPDAGVVGRGLFALIAQLPADQHAAFVLQTFHDLELSEIAAALEVPVGTVKSRISRARSRLRAGLTQEVS